MINAVTKRYGGIVGFLQGSMPRDEFFAGLYILGCANGIGLRVIKSVNELGWADAFFATFQVSGIVLMACLAGISLLLLDKSDEIRVADLVFGAGFLVVIAVPINPAIWVAITALSFYILLLTNPQSARRRGATILLATAVPMFWSPYLFKFFANFILELDASLVGWVLHSARVGNMVRFADDFWLSRNIPRLLFARKRFACLFMLDYDEPIFAPSMVPSRLGVVSLGMRRGSRRECHADKHHGIKSG